MNFIDKVHDTICGLSKNIFTEEQVASALGISNGFDLRALQQALQSLTKSGKIAKTARGKYTLGGGKKSVVATIFTTKSGYAFAKRENAEAGEKDIFISQRDLSDAAHGDKVLLEILPAAKGKSAGERTCGKVVQIIERGYKQIVGLLTISGGAAIVEPEDKHFTSSIFIPTECLNGATENTKVVVEITAYPARSKMAQGKIIEVLGDAASVKVSTLSIIRSFGLKQEFDAGVEDEAAAVAVPISEADMVNRKDYRNQLVITIDGEDARDFDDAFSVSKKDDKYYLSVHIADVSHYVKEGSKIDAEAFKRGTSVYFPDYVLPMLPVSLSNGMCSLNPNEDRLTLSVEIVLDNKGEVLSSNIYKGVIHSTYRMTYTKVTGILNKDKDLTQEYSKIVPMLATGKELAELLIARRNRAGQLDFDLPEPQIIVDENYNTVDIVRKPRELADRLIEQFMVITNEVVAKQFSQLKLPFIYRVHEDPTPERVNNFASFVSGFGLKLNRSARPTDFQKLLIDSKKEPYGSTLAKVMLRSMQKARYSPENLGHFGLALKNYCHFTSPIRRYPDLTIHRIISYYLENKLTPKKVQYLLEFVKDASEQSSLTERNAEQAERAVDDQKKAEFMVDKVGQVFDATVSGASESGVYVELANTVEGLINTEKLPQDRYIYDEAKVALIGKNNSYRIGDSLRVRLDDVDLSTRHIDFSLESGGREPVSGKHQKAINSEIAKTSTKNRKNYVTKFENGGKTRKSSTETNINGGKNRKNYKNVNENDTENRQNYSKIAVNNNQFVGGKYKGKAHTSRRNSTKSRPGRGRGRK